MPQENSSMQPLSRITGAYSASLLGTIRSHLEGLQGYDVMALELIQNADDAEAEELIFDISNHGLNVTNSGQFTYCGDLSVRPCGFLKNGQYGCDFHRITEVASGGKLSRSENIGRFGIGFVSTYQITDHPEIRSAGIKLTLLPETGQWIVEPERNVSGTTFYLPWATDPDTEGRRALGASHISDERIEELVEDFKTVIRKSLLFLRHVKKAEVRRSGKLLLACDLDRSEGSDLILSFRPGRDIEHWHILRADAQSAAVDLFKIHPRLEMLGRSTKVSIGLRIDPAPLEDGMLYAYLPTEQSSGLPLHINADFFPEADRKALIFSGHQHQQAWNEMLIDVAAAEVARDPEALLQMVGHVQLWKLIGSSFDLTKSQRHPKCFHNFWDRMKVTGVKSRIAVAQDDSVHLPSDVMLPRSTLTETQVKTLGEVGGRVNSESLRWAQNVIAQLGAPIFTLERLTNLMEHAFATLEPGSTEVLKKRVEEFYVPLWSMVNDLLPDSVVQGSTPNATVKKLLDIPFVVTDDFYVVTIAQSYIAPAPLKAKKVALLLPRLAILPPKFLELPKLSRLAKQLSLGDVADHLNADISSHDATDSAISTKEADLRDFYSFLAELDRQGGADATVYKCLQGLPIWSSGKGLVRADQALLPGNFNDPTGQAELLDPNVFSDSAREFVSTKIGIKSQTIEAFVTTVLPRVFDEDGPLDATKYRHLVTELANHPSLIDDENIRSVLASFPIIPTQDGAWAKPTNTYRRTDDLVKVLGNATHLWVDQTRIPNSRSVSSFLDSLGIRKFPSPLHLAERIRSIAERFLPTEDAKRESGEAFYVLCDRYKDWKDTPAFREALASLRGGQFFPAENDKTEWHTAESLYAPYRAEAFRTQVRVLDFRSTLRLETDLLKALGISTEPETQLVVNHLFHCVEKGVNPHIFTYQVLNERAGRSDPLIAQLQGKRCVWVESQKWFVRPNQLYWTAQQLGRYAFTIPGNFESLKALFHAIKVKNSPDFGDYIDLILDIVGEHYEKGVPVEGADLAVYETCLSGIVAINEADANVQIELARLKEAPSILNLLGRPTYPDEILLQDSEWHATFFNGELDQALCKPAPENWELFELIGVHRLSECADVELEFVDGEKIPEQKFSETLRDRAEILARLLHDKGTAVRKSIAVALLELTAFSYDVVRIQAKVRIGDNEVCAPPSLTQAFYDVVQKHLILSRPVGPRSWSPALNALFHQLMPDESGSEISKLTLSIRPLMGMSVEDAHRELTDAGIPFLSADQSYTRQDLTSPDLEDIGGAVDSNVAATSTIETTTRVASNTHADSAGESGATKSTSSSNAVESGAQKQREEATSTSNGGRENEGGGHKAGDSAHGQSHGKRTKKNHRPQHKQQWDRRLLSYVRMKSETDVDRDSQDNLTDHNLAVEVIAREAVCVHEKERGRIAEQMPQTHPGYDIISSDPLTGEQRFIEVKGVNGEWNLTGVGLSRLQFSNAQNYGASYWLYVVEYVSDPKNIRVHPICNPATQVTAFMFDGKWRDAVDDERADPSLAFVKGVRVKHKMFGDGIIESFELRGLTRVLLINFDIGGRRPLPLNLGTIEIVEDDEDNNGFDDS